MYLKQLGVKPIYQEELAIIQEERKDKHRQLARVIVEHKQSYKILTDTEELSAVVSGAFAHQAMERADYPAVGDWVIIEKLIGEAKAVIHKLLTRQSSFSRKIAGLTTEEQIVAANVDFVFIVMSMNDDFKVRRLERYLIAAWDSGATPVIVLTKADLVDDVSSYIADAESVAFGVEIFAVSALTGLGVEKLSNYLEQGKTGTLLGSSGVGKSSLINALLAEDYMSVQTIREDDAKGRHTTTHRELILLSTGGCLIDTPGMRELQLWDQSGHLETSFQDIEELALQCKFRDCTHTSEPNCAVKQAVEKGQLEQGRLKSYFKLQRELAYLDRKANIRAQQAETKKWKQVSKQIKHRK
ncbi:ribosome small subunit-dependent GTPase A [Amphibacillus sp. Q70]|uniref:ribosome small subunit-dependent GTPase A n=1 Tax=Amphibacillus sp. Q70 TaxID=3453416 RepID=UPI003F86A68E